MDYITLSNGVKMPQLGIWRISGDTGGMRTLRTGCTKGRLSCH